MSNTANTTLLQRNDMQMHGKVFAHVPVGFHGNTHVNAHPPAFILPNSTAALQTSPVNLTTANIPTVVWVPIPSPPPSPSNKTTLGTLPPTPIKNENIEMIVQDSQEKNIKSFVGIAKSTTKAPALTEPTMWRPW